VNGKAGKGKESPPRQLGDCLLLSNMGMNYGKERRKGEEGDGAPYIQVVGKVTSKATIYL
jgi:hypothetical protein